MNREWLFWIFIGGIILYFIYSPWRNIINGLFRWRETSEDEGYELDTVYAKSISNAVLPPKVITPDYPNGIGLFDGFFRSKDGSCWTLLTDEGIEIPNISSLDHGVNIDYGDPIPTACGNGVWKCNIDTLGIEHRNWEGVGNPSASSQAKQIKLLKTEIDNERVMRDDMSKETERLHLQNAELIGKLTKLRGRRIADEEKEIED